MTLKNNELIRGDSRTIKVTFKDASGNVIDLTGCTAYLTMNHNSNPTSDDTAAIQKVKDTFDEPESGQAIFRIVPTDWDGVEPGQYWLDAQLTDDEGNKLSRKREQITVIPDITRS